MNSEGVSSLAVVDNQFNVVGNISSVDVKVFVFHRGSNALIFHSHFELKGYMKTNMIGWSSSSRNRVRRLYSKIPASTSSLWCYLPAV